MLWGGWLGQVRLGLFDIIRSWQTCMVGELDWANWYWKTCIGQKITVSLGDISFIKDC